MLYKKNDQPFSVSEFMKPSCEYRATPFWAWNNKLNADELTRQIEDFKELGFGGFHMHVRTGLATEYLSEEYMDVISACVEKARRENMLAWLYDEDRWPSGAAGGIVTKDEQFRRRSLLLSRHPREGRLIACYDIALNDEGKLEKYRRIGIDDAVSGFKLYAYCVIDGPDPWFNNQAYVNTLNPAAIREFIKVTHERYREYFAGDFGGIIPAIFTDEPQFGTKGTLRFAHEDRDVFLPWTDAVAESYAAAFGADNLIDGIPELIWDLQNDRVSLIRYRYHDHITELFTSAFADQIGSWCAKNNIMLTGHMMGEPTLESQCHEVGEAMRAYRSFQLPGIDMLCDRYEFTTAKQAQSAARQYGCPGVLSEMYGVTNWDFDFRGHKLQGDWQAALGVTVRVPHLSWVSMNGNAKRDYPGTFSYQAPWYKEYPYIEDHFARLNTALTRGKAVTRVGIIHPIESYWLHWGPGENTQAAREQMDENFQNLCDWMLRGLIDFDYICESTLPALCDKSRIKSGGPFPVGKSAYDCVIVPALETIRHTTLMLLEAFHAAGGRIILLGSPPGYVDAQKKDSALWAKCERLGFERLPLLKALAPVRDLEIRSETGAVAQNLLYQLREDQDGSRWLFIAHAGRPVNPDIPSCEMVQIKINGRWEASRYETISGGIFAQPACIERECTVITVPLYEHDSLLFRLEGFKGQCALSDQSNKHPVKPVLANKYPNDTQDCFLYAKPVKITLHEPNVLLLDIAEFALDNEPYRPAEEILRLDWILRAELGWPQRKKAVAQPWVENDTSTAHRLRLRYSFESEAAIEGAELALENSGSTVVALNGNPVSAAGGWYVDRCMEKVKLPQIKIGTNILELELPYGRKTDAEACYLLGDFGVKVNGTHCTLTPPVQSLAFGDITRQGLPFYGGNISYHFEAESVNGSFAISASCYRGMMLRVRVDGEDKGVIAFSPYRVTVTGLKDGLHQIDLVFYGCRINTFGQLHCNIRDPGYWWGADSWRSAGSAWTYEYKFWTQGILKSPEIRSVE